MIERFKGRSERIDYWLERQAAPFLRKNLVPEEVLENIIHFLESLNAPKKIDKVSFLRAQSLMEKWFSKLQNKKINQVESEGAVEFIYDDEPYTWVKLKSQASYDREGKLMGHCVASYFSHKDIVIYSLRDENNEPHCTIEIKNNKILQIKGRGNKPVVPKYHAALRKFINGLNLPLHTGDAWNYGWLVIKSETGDKMVPETELPEEVEITWTHGMVKLSAYAKIPKKMKVHSVKISNHKCLDLSQWEITSRLELENCQNVTLPETIPSDFDLRLSNVKFNKEYAKKLKATSLILSMFYLNKTKMEVNRVEASILASLHSASIKAKELKMTNQAEVQNSTLEVEHLFVKSLNKSDSLPLASLNKVKNFTVALLVLTDEILPLVNNISLQACSNVELRLSSNFTWPSHWKNIMWLKIIPEHLNKIDFKNLETVIALDFETNVIIGNRPKENSRIFLDNLELLKNPPSSHIVKQVPPKK